MGAVLVAGAGVGVVALVSSERASAATPWECTTAASYFTVASGDTTVRSIDTTTGETVLMRKIADRAIGGVGFNPADGFVYGWDQTARALVRIDADLQITPVPMPASTSVLTAQFFTIFAIDDAGQLWMTTTNPNASVARPWFVVDLADGSATYGEVVRSGNWAPPTGHYVTPDFVFSGSGMVGISTAVNDPEAAPRLFGIDTATGATVDHGSISGLTSHAQFGAAWIGADGRLNAVRNSGAVWAVDLATREAEMLFEDATIASNNADGTNCGAVPPPPATPQPTPQPTASPDTSPSTAPSDSPAVLPPGTPGASLAPLPTSDPSPSTPPGQAAPSLPTTPTPEPVDPTEALAATRTALTLHVSEHARGTQQEADRSALVLTLMNPGNREVRRPVVALVSGQRTEDLSCAVPDVLAAGASATCVVSVPTPSAGATLQARAVAGASSLVTAAPVPLGESGRSAPNMSAEATSRRVGTDVEVTVTVRNTGDVALRNVAVQPVRVGDAGAPVHAVCDDNARLLMPGESTRCDLAVPVAVLEAAVGAGADSVDAAFRATALPVGWATPIQSAVVRHTLDLMGD